MTDIFALRVPHCSADQAAGGPPRDQGTRDCAHLPGSTAKSSQTGTFSSGGTGPLEGRVHEGRGVVTM